MAGPSLGEEAPDSKPQGRGLPSIFWMETVGCLLEEKGLLLGCLRENRLREEMAERGERMMALKWPAGL